MQFREIGRVAVVLAVVLSTACGEGGASQTGDDQNLTEVASKDLKLEKGTMGFGDSRRTSVSKGDKILAYPFDGTAGDVINAEVFATTAGTGYLLKEIGAGHYALLASQTQGKTGAVKLDITLRTSGRFYIGFKPNFPVKAAKSQWATAIYRLAGQPQDSGSAWLQDLKSAFEEGNANDEFIDISESKLPPAALKAWNKANKDWGPDYPPAACTWAFKGKKVYVVKEENDGGMFISFYDASGKRIAGGSAGESSEFTWD